MPLHLSKPGLRVLGIAESFVRSSPRSRLAGVVMRSDLRIDGLALTSISVAGDDATSGVLDLFRQLHRDDINAILLSGAVISWFNIIDLQQVFDELKIPLVCLTYDESSGLEGYIQEYFPGCVQKLDLYGRLGRREMISLKTGHSVYIRALGVSLIEARVLINKFTLDGRIPEPLRVARLMARAALHSDIGQ
jgi:uncharacterized protein